jgi:valyl-tRNA synthetase
VLPFATEEVWSWWREGSVHRAPWPDAEPLRAAAGDGDPAVVAAAGAALAALRKVKSEAKVSMRTEIVRARLEVPAALLPGVQVALGDVRAAGRATGTLDVVEVPDGPEAAVVARDAELLPPEPKQKPTA